MFASVFVLQCRCGQGLNVYVPKARLFGEVLHLPGNWDLVDRREQADGDLVAAQQQAEAFGASFLDGRQVDLVCPGCGALVRALGEGRPAVMPTVA